MSFLKKRMLNGECVFGTWTMIPSPTVADVLGRTGLDFLVIDLEHGSISWETAENMVLAAKLSNCQPIIRVGDDNENTILHALETDCQALMVPHVKTFESAEKISKYARYSPLGTRGLSPYTRCHDYTHEELASSMIRHAEDTLVGILVEGIEGIKNLEKIVKSDGIDLIYLGMYDISQAVGRPGELEHPDVIKQLEYCLNVIKKAGKLSGTFARDMKACLSFKNMGFSFVAYVADSYGLKYFFEDAVSEFRKK